MGSACGPPRVRKKWGLIDDCSVCAIADNYPEPGKRPLSSTAPTIIEHEDGSFYVAIGGSGGSRIFPSIYQTLFNLDWGLDASQAVEYGRLHNQLFPILTDADNVYPPHLLDELRSRGHNITSALLLHFPASFINNILSGVSLFPQSLTLTEWLLLFNWFCNATVSTMVSPLGQNAFGQISY